MGQSLDSTQTKSMTFVSTSIFAIVSINFAPQNNRMLAPVLVLKIGSAAITTPQGDVDEKAITSVALQISQLHNQYRIIIVSSGAVATGKPFIKNYSGKIAERKAAAAIGNPLLIDKYTKAFQPHGIAIAQSLCERQHFSKWNTFSQLKETINELWNNGIIPIANENDVVSDLELRFSDNDELATLIAVGFDAEVLLIGSTVSGLLDKDKKVVPLVEKIDESILGLANTEKSSVGLGGMVSKLTFARLATRLGIRVHIFGLREPNGILQALSQQSGTTFLPAKSSATPRQKWLASGNLVTGKVQVDAGAATALQNRKSLLAVGVKKVKTSFEKGEIIEILDEKGLAIAVARAKHSSVIIKDNLKTQNFEIAHADDIVLL